MEKENKYYVYIYLDPRKPGKYHYSEVSLCFLYEPFYIGKGKGNRYKTHLYESNESNKFKKIKIKKIKDNNQVPFIVILDGLSEEVAFLKEISLIKLIGRANLKKGTLTNLTNGGDGNSGHIHSDEHKNKIKNSLLNLHKSAPHKGMKYEDFYGVEKAKEIKNKQSKSLTGKKNKYKGKKLEDILGFKKSQEVKNKMCLSMMVDKNHFFNKKHSELSIKKLKDSHLGLKNNKKEFIFINPQGKKIVVLGEFKNFCKKHNLSWKAMFNISKNKRKNKLYNGWTIKRVT